MHIFCPPRLLLGSCVNSCFLSHKDRHSACIPVFPFLCISGTLLHTALPAYTDAISYLPDPDFLI